MTRVMNVDAIFIKCIAPFVYVSVSVRPALSTHFNQIAGFGFSFLNSHGNWMSWVKRLSISVCLILEITYEKRTPSQTKQQQQRILRFAVASYSNILHCIRKRAGNMFFLSVCTENSKRFRVYVILRRTIFQQNYEMRRNLVHSNNFESVEWKFFV